MTESKKRAASDELEADGRPVKRPRGPDEAIALPQRVSSCHASAKRLCGNADCAVCFARSFASSPYVTHWSSKNAVPACQVAQGSRRSFLMCCPTCHHEYDAQPSAVVKRASPLQCGFCCDSPRRLCDNANCEPCFAKSFASHPKAGQWAPRNSSTARQTFLGSFKKAFFSCADCGHEFEAAVYSITKNGSWCPFCATQRLCNDAHCERCLERSFASHDKAAFWAADLNKATPRQVFKSSHTKVWFRCGECKHSFESNPHRVTAGHWCPFCGLGRLCEDNECKHCLERSFASHPRAQFWLVAENGSATPRSVPKHSSAFFSFRCDVCDSVFCSALFSITLGRWCPHCLHKTTLKLGKFLDQLFPGQQVDREASFPWSKIDNQPRVSRFDFGLVARKLLVELDGQQHFQQVANWRSPDDARKADVAKMVAALCNGFSMVRLVQTEVRADQHDWQARVTAVLQQPPSQPSVLYVFAPGSKIYDNHIADLRKLLPTAAQIIVP